MTKIDNSKYQENNGMTALQILEDKLLKPNKNHLSKLVPQHSQIERTENNFNSCFAAFGKNSPLCYTRRKAKRSNKKFISKRGVTFFPKKYFLGPKIHPNNDHSVIEDFFSIFTTDSSTVHESKPQTPPFEVDNFKSSSVMSKLTTVSPMSIMDKFKPYFENLEDRDNITLRGKFEASFENGKEFNSIGDILPHNRTSRSQGNKSEILVLERDGDRRQMVNQYFKEEKDFYNNATHASSADEMFTQSNINLNESNHLLATTSVSGDGHSQLMKGNQLADIKSSSSDRQRSEWDYHSESIASHRIQSSTDVGTLYDIGKTTASSRLSKDVKSRAAVDQNSLVDKSACEMTYNKTCVCSFVRLGQDLRDIFRQATYSKVIYQDIGQTRCKHYVPKTETFQLTAQLKPKVLSANRRPMAVDEDNGPKEIEPASLERFIKESATADGLLMFLFT